MIGWGWGLPAGTCLTAQQCLSCFCYSCRPHHAALPRAGRGQRAHDPGEHDEVSGEEGGRGCAAHAVHAALCCAVLCTACACAWPDRSIVRLALAASHLLRPCPTLLRDAQAAGGAVPRPGHPGPAALLRQRHLQRGRLPPGPQWPGRAAGPRVSRATRAGGWLHPWPRLLAGCWLGRSLHSIAPHRWAAQPVVQSARCRCLAGGRLARRKGGGLSPPLRSAVVTSVCVPLPPSPLARSLTDCDPFALTLPSTAPHTRIPYLL